MTQNVTVGDPGGYWSKTHEIFQALEILVFKTKHKTIWKEIDFS